MDENYMSGSELRKYLHISTRKLKFIMDNGLIPHEDTGRITHKYQISKTEAAKFKKRMAKDKNFMIEYRGLFSSRGNQFERVKAKVDEYIDWVIENTTEFKSYIKQIMKALPDAIPVQEAARLIGVNPKSLHRLKHEGKLNSVNVGHIQYCAKQEIIEYMVSEVQIRFNRTEEYLKYYKGFLRKMGIKF